MCKDDGIVAETATNDNVHRRQKRNADKQLAGGWSIEACRQKILDSHRGKHNKDTLQQLKEPKNLLFDVKLLKAWKEFIRSWRFFPWRLLFTAVHDSSCYGNVILCQIICFQTPLRRKNEAYFKYPVQAARREL